MKTYNEMIGYSHDNPQGREKTEWSNFWYDKPNESYNERILLVGDSTVRMIRSRFAKLRDCPVDMIGSSSGLHDILFISQMDAFFLSNKFKYDAIFIQLGHHSKINELGEWYSEEDYTVFKKDYEVLIEYLSQFSTNIILLSVFYDVVLGKSKTQNAFLNKLQLEFRRFKGEVYNDEINEIKKRKNDIIKSIADEHGYKYLDINQYMIKLAENRKTRCIHVDHIHYEEKAKDIIVKEYIELLGMGNNKRL